MQQVSERGNSINFFSFLLKLSKAYDNKKVYIVLDNVAYHHSKRIKAVLERYKHKMEFIFLPPYSPDLNPMERIWWYMRKKITHNRATETMEKRIENFRNFITPMAEQNETGMELCNLCTNIY